MPNNLNASKLNIMIISISRKGIYVISKVCKTYSLLFVFLTKSTAMKCVLIMIFTDNTRTGTLNEQYISNIFTVQKW